MGGSSPSAFEASVTVVVTNYNTWADTCRCVERCLRFNDERLCVVLVVDDASTEPLTEIAHPKVRVERNPENLGLVRTLNRALGMVETELTVIFDSDAYPLTEFVGPVVEAFEEPGLALVAFRTEDEAGRPTESCCPEPSAFGLALGQALDAHLGRWLPKSPYLSVFTCAMAVRMNAFRQVGGFDENFDWLDLDQDLSMAINRAGWRVEPLPSVRAFHKGGGTPQKVSHRVLRHYKNRWYLLQKYHKIRNERLLKAVILLRLRGELVSLALFGKSWIKDRTVLQDKIEGRRRVIDFCERNYARGQEV